MNTVINQFSMNKYKRILYRSLHYHIMMTGLAPVPKLAADMAAMLPRPGISQTASLRTVSLHHRPIGSEEPQPRAGFVQGCRLQ